MVSTRIKRASLDDAFDASVTAAITLRAQLRLYETAARAAIASGQVISSVSATNGAGGRSTSFFQVEGMSPVETLEMWRELIDLNDLVVEQESLTDNVANRTAIKTEMMGLLKPCFEATNDFRNLRVGQPVPA